MDNTVTMSAELSSRLESWLAAQNGHLTEKDREARRKALEVFELTGIPGRKHEEWKYTDVRAWSEFTPIDGEATASFDAFLPGLDANRLVFVNGRFDAEASSIESQEGVFAGSLAEARKAFPEVIAAELGRQVELNDRAFAAVNSAFFPEDAACIIVQRNVVADRPILIEERFADLGSEHMALPRHLLIAGENAQVRVIRRSTSAGELRAVSQSEVVLAQSARVQWVEVQEGAAAVGESRTINMMDAEVERDSRFEFRSFALGGELVRNDTHVRFRNGPAETDLQGFYHASDGELIDNHLLIDHAVPNCHSNQLYKGILEGNGKGVFNGKIFVRQDAQKTEAYQSNKNLVLSQHASMNSKPQLEIWADDVRCSHGATSGQLDEEAMFYLQARGLSPDSARALLLKAFAGELLSGIPEDPLYNYLEDRIAARLEGAEVPA